MTILMIAGAFGANICHSEPIPIWATLNTDNSDLPSNVVTSFSAGRDRSVWVGTNGGLARLDEDGRWQTFTTSSTKGGLPGDDILALAAGANDDVWVGTNGSGLARLDKYGRWQSFTKDSTKGGLPGNEVRALAVSTDESVWVGTDGGLAQLEKEGHWRTYTTKSTNGGLPNDTIRALAISTDGSVWIGTADGLARLEKAGRRIYPTKSTDGGLPSNLVNTLAAGTDGSVWIGTDRGFTQYNGDKIWRTFNYGGIKRGIPYDEVVTLSAPANGSIWAGTSLSLVQVDKNGHWQYFTEDHENYSVPSDNIQALLALEDGSVWVGTDRGLAKYVKEITGRLRIIEIVGAPRKGEVVSQSGQIVAVVGFDSSYRTLSYMFRYIWRLDQIRSFKNIQGPEIEKKSPFHEIDFQEDGDYVLNVTAVDRFGNKSESISVPYKVKLHRPGSLLDDIKEHWDKILASLAALYAIIFGLLLLATHWSTRALRILSDEVWSKWLGLPLLVLRHVPAVQRWVLEPWFQEVRRRTRGELPFVDPPARNAAGATVAAGALLPRMRDKPRILSGDTTNCPPDDMRN